MGTVVDVHHHVVPSGLVERIRREGREFGGSIRATQQGAEAIHLPDGTELKVRSNLADADLRRDELAKAGIDLGLESLLPPLMFYRAERDAAARYARLVNESIAENAARYPGHVEVMAHVPMQYPDLAVQELRYAVNELGARSVQIGSNVQGLNLDEEAFFPFWEEAASLGILVFVHPHDRTAPDRLMRYRLVNLIGNPLDTSIAVASIIFGGVLDRYPSLNFCFAHAGGYAPWIRGRWRHGQQVRPETRERGAQKSVDEYFAQLYFDTIIHDDQAFEFLVKSVGADHILHGTDYPADMGNWHQASEIRKLEWLTEEEKAAILGGNALRLLERP